jgi:hypothetical protein
MSKQKLQRACSLSRRRPLAYVVSPCHAAFPYPIALTMWHMLFCAALAMAIIKAGYVEPVKMSVGEPWWGQVA